MYKRLGIFNRPRRLLLLGRQRVRGGPRLVEVLVGVGGAPVRRPVVCLVGPVVCLPVTGGGGVGVLLGGGPGVGGARGVRGLRPGVVGGPVVVGPGGPRVVVVGGGAGLGLEVRAGGEGVCGEGRRGHAAAGSAGGGGGAVEGGAGRKEVVGLEAGDGGGAGGAEGVEPARVGLVGEGVLDVEGVLVAVVLEGVVGEVHGGGGVGLGDKGGGERGECRRAAA